MYKLNCGNFYFKYFWGQIALANSEYFLAILWLFGGEKKAYPPGTFVLNVTRPSENLPEGRWI